MSGESCIFCKIVRGEIPADIVSRTENVVVFRDIMPMAPVHMLAIPVRHVRHLSEFVATASPEEIAELFSAAASSGVAASPNGYRVVTNEGSDGGQTVFHLHLHVLAGRPMRWPPG